VARVIALALPLGVLAFWVIAWVMTDGGARGRAQGGLDPRLAFWAWAALALGGLGAALVLRGRAVAIAEESARAGAAGARAGEVQTALVMAWALLETQALLAGVLLLAFGLEQIVVYAGIVYGVGLLLTFPRAEWWGVGATGRRG
jgi:hypothetical protein